MAATNENPIIFYDIVGKDGQHWSPNPYKTRLTLNYKGLPYRVKFVKFEDVESTLKAMGIPPTSKTFPNYTLPMIADPSSDPDGKPTYVSESLNIAAYLDDKYPSPRYPTVLPSGTHSLQKIFIDHYLPIIAGPLYPIIKSRMPELLDEQSQEYLYRSRGGKQNFKPLAEAEASQKLTEAHEKWEAFSKTLELNGSGNASPFVMGDKITFVDFAIGGVLSFFQKVEGDEGKSWKEIMVWQDGKWERLWKEIEALEKRTIKLT